MMIQTTRPKQITLFMECPIAVFISYNLFLSPWEINLTKKNHFSSLYVSTRGIINYHSQPGREMNIHARVSDDENIRLSRDSFEVFASGHDSRTSILGLG